MLDVIGAGATAFSSINWHEIWKKSPEIKKVEQEIEEIHTKGKNRPAVETALRNEYPTPWFNQVSELVKRSAADNYRNSEYLFAKLILNVGGGLFIGVSFVKNAESMQGIQNRIFVRLLFVGWDLCRSLTLIFFTRLLSCFWSSGMSIRIEATCWVLIELLFIVNPWPT